MLLCCYVGITDLDEGRSNELSNVLVTGNQLGAELNVIKLNAFPCSCCVCDDEEKGTRYGH